MAVKHGLCLLALRIGYMLVKPSAWGIFCTLSTRNTMTECRPRSISCGSTGTSSGYYQETGHVTRHDSLSKTILQGTLERGWVVPWLAEEMLDGEHQRVDIPARVRTAHKGLLLKRLEEDLC